MLWYAERVAAGQLPAHNGGFLVTKHEEAGSTLPRTAPQFAADLANGTLGMSDVPRRTFVCFLENTVSLASPQPSPVHERHERMQERMQERMPRARHARTDEAPSAEVAVYDRERHSFALVCRGALGALGQALLRLEGHHEWKAVAAWPVVDEGEGEEEGEGKEEDKGEDKGEDKREDKGEDKREDVGEGGGGAFGREDVVGGAVVGGAVEHGAVRRMRRLEPSEALTRCGVAAAALRSHVQEGGHSCTVRNEASFVYRTLVREAVRCGGADALRRRDAGEGLPRGQELPLGQELPPAALTAWAACSAADDEEAGWAEGGDEGTALLWSGVATQPTRVASSSTTLPRAALTGTALTGTALTGATPAGRAWPAADQPHELLLNYRGLKPIGQVQAQIAQLASWLGADSVRWAAGADLASGEGAQQHAFVGASGLAALLDGVMEEVRRGGGALTLTFEPNPGRSDASQLWRALPAELRGERVVPFTCGPGHRSHRCADEGVMRKTHGPNEGFHKATGRACLPFFVRLVGRFALE